MPIAEYVRGVQVLHIALMESVSGMLHREVFHAKCSNLSLRRLTRRLRDFRLRRRFRVPKKVLGQAQARQIRILQRIAKQNSEDGKFEVRVIADTFRTHD
jgi:hypothetical protein